MTQPSVRFVCAHNAGQSQMAAGQVLESVRPIRDEIKVRVEALLADAEGEWPNQPRRR